MIFNVGNNQPLAFADLTAEKFETFWRTCTLAGFLTAKAALQTLEDNGGSLLFTGASASMRGRPGFAHFSAAKAGLRVLAQEQLDFRARCTALQRKLVGNASGVIGSGIVA